LLAHITGNANAETFQPMNVNFGLFPPIPSGKGGRDRKLAYTERAKKDLTGWLMRLENGFSQEHSATS
jgi:methylenetetrahydrofolate--tRNA-(uracil-5-)-methyltransferase